MKHFIVSFLICVPFLLSAQIRTIEVIVTDTVQRELDFIICELEINMDYEYEYYEEEVEAVEELEEEAVEAYNPYKVIETQEEKVAKLQTYIREHNYELVNPFPKNFPMETIEPNRLFFIKVKNMKEFMGIQQDVGDYASTELYNVVFKTSAEYDKQLAQKLVKKANEEAAITASVMGKSLGEIMELSEIEENNDLSDILSLAMVERTPGFSTTSRIIGMSLVTSFSGVYTKSFKVKFELK
jgi:hypothetical protein